MSHWLPRKRNSHTKTIQRKLGRLISGRTSWGTPTAMVSKENARKLLRWIYKRNTLVSKTKMQTYLLRRINGKAIVCGILTKPAAFPSTSASQRQTETTTWTQAPRHQENKTIKSIGEVDNEVLNILDKNCKGEGEIANLAIKTCNFNTSFPIIVETTGQKTNREADLMKSV